MAYMMGGGAVAAALWTGHALLKWWWTLPEATSIGVEANRAAGAITITLGHPKDGSSGIKKRPAIKDSTAPSLHTQFVNEIQTFFKNKSLKPVPPKKVRDDIVRTEIELLLLCELEKREAAWGTNSQEEVEAF